MKILCLGNNTEDSDLKARRCAQQRNLPCHGLISDLDSPGFSIADLKSGVYHTTVFDLDHRRLTDLANACDLVIVLDQPKNSYGHPDAWMQMHRLLANIKTACQLHPAIDAIETWQQLLDRNPAFCVLPWVESMLGDAADVNAVKLCCRSDIRIDDDRHHLEWQSDQRYIPIRQAMLAGQQVPHCQSCYQQEAQGLISDRRTETLEWCNRLGLDGLESLASIRAPAYVEIRANNRCNLMCRMCNAHSSHRIANEYQQLGLIEDQPRVDRSRDLFAEIDITSLRKLYVSGGEPLLNPDLFKWLDQCREQGTTNFECVINTNGTKLPQRLRRHLPWFPNLQFIFSIDAFGATNDYIRWGSRWDDIVGNWRYLRDQGHRVHVNTTVSVYNVHRLSELYAFIDREFPDTLMHINLVQDPSYLDFALCPDPLAALQDLDRARACGCVHNNPLVDQVLAYVQRRLDQAPLRNIGDFFRFNDLLDRSRGSILANHDSFLDGFRP